MNEVKEGSTGLEGWLTDDQTKQYLALIEVDFYKPDLASLRTIVRNTYRKVPFQNLTMLTRVAKSPSPECIVQDMLSGIGGLCTTINPFIAALLQKLGFDVDLLMVSMDQPDCHIGIRVTLDRQPYWLDLGNGFPYLEPCL